ncbi:MAG TPA: low molecular weight protein-tyrosine-phosphatase [Sandaracinaceae bacterium LLY-WYZ-13_1]|nr:low molecular weight protein-tyrosine-phosphatase [Sandaracinaceae bacterium LLY-WYZ-13_1]
MRICFVCLGNICRSPTAEAVFVDLLASEGLDHRFEIDSAGTGSWHVGERAHPDTRAAAQARGIEIASVARQFQPSDFARFDYVVAMDRSNHANLERMAPDEDALAKLHMFRAFDPSSPAGAEVPDPYYEGGFDRVYEICEAAARGLLAHLRERHGL